MAENVDQVVGLGWRTLIGICYALVTLRRLKLRNDKMDNYELIKVTEGKNRRKSLVYHIIDHKKNENYELLINHVCQNTLVLR